MSVVQNSPPTNIEVISQLTQRIAQSLVREAKITTRDTCNVKFINADNLQFLEHTFMKSLQQLTSFVTANLDKTEHSVNFEIQPSQAFVQYNNMFREGFLGEKKVERMITVELSAKIVRNQSGDILFAGMKQEQFRDTVNVELIEHLESPAVKATHAVLPSETFFDRIMEPLVIITATGILIYLFFTVRS